MLQKSVFMKGIADINKHNKFSKNILKIYYSLQFVCKTQDPFI